MFTAANPPGTVTVTALLGGECQRVDLAPAVAALTERELAGEIVAVAEVAAQKAAAGAYELFAALFRGQGQDAASLTTCCNATCTYQHRNRPWPPRPNSPTATGDSGTAAK